MGTHVPTRLWEARTVGPQNLPGQLTVEGALLYDQLREAGLDEGSALAKWLRFEALRSDFPTSFVGQESSDSAAPDED